MNGFREEKMAQRKAPPDSISTAHTQKPFVRLDDIGDASLIVGIISGVFLIGSFIAIIVLFGEIIEIVEKDFALKPTMESDPLQSPSSD